VSQGYGIGCVAIKKQSWKANPCNAKRDFFAFECMVKTKSDADMQNEWIVREKRNQKSSSKVKDLLGAGISAVAVVVDEVFTPALA